MKKPRIRDFFTLALHEPSTCDERIKSIIVQEDSEVKHKIKNFGLWLSIYEHRLYGNSKD